MAKQSVEEFIDKTLAQLAENLRIVVDDERHRLPDKMTPEVWWEFIRAYGVEGGP
jgi:hypothetical protein